MAFKCKATSSDPWVSSIGPVSAPVDDGTIVINSENSNGDFKGRHRKMSVQQGVSGKCREASSGRPHRIWFVRPEVDPEFFYMGNISTNGLRITGRRFTLAVGALTLADDEWTATKTTLVGGGRTKKGSANKSAKQSTKSTSAKGSRKRSKKP